MQKEFLITMRPSINITNKGAVIAHIDQYDWTLIFGKEKAEHEIKHQKCQAGLNSTS